MMEKTSAMAGIMAFVGICMYGSMILGGVIILACVIVYKIDKKRREQVNNGLMGDEQFYKIINDSLDRSERQDYRR